MPTELIIDIQQPYGIDPPKLPALGLDGEATFFCDLVGIYKLHGAEETLRVLWCCSDGYQNKVQFIIKALNLVFLTPKIGMDTASKIYDALVAEHLQK